MRTEQINSECWDRFDPEFGDILQQARDRMPIGLASRLAKVSVQS